jgi:acyl carrier protein
MIMEKISDEELLSRLEGILRLQFLMPELKLTLDLSSASFPEWDSLSHINLMFAIGEDFGVEFTAEEIAETQSVGQIIDRLKEKFR